MMEFWKTGLKKKRGKRIKAGRKEKFCSDRIYRIFRIIVFGMRTKNILLILSILSSLSLGLAS